MAFSEETIQRVWGKATPNECENFLSNRNCDPWIIDKFECKEYSGKIEYRTATDSEEAEKICSTCPNFKRKP
ncbi:MAG: hypothetical protein WC560_08165 [Syntrophales bacterium]